MNYFLNPVNDTDIQKPNLNFCRFEMVYKANYFY